MPWVPGRPEAICLGMPDDQVLNLAGWGRPAKIVRTREVTFKAGEEITIDLRKKDDKVPDNVIIRWVPTPKIVVKDMCELAKVTDKDVVYDLGCGDARIVVTAAIVAPARRKWRGASMCVPRCMVVSISLTRTPSLANAGINTSL